MAATTAQSNNARTASWIGGANFRPAPVLSRPVARCTASGSKGVRSLKGWIRVAGLRFHTAVPSAPNRVGKRLMEAEAVLGSYLALHRLGGHSFCKVGMVPTVEVWIREVGIHTTRYPTMKGAQDRARQPRPESRSLADAFGVSSSRCWMRNAPGSAGTPSRRRRRGCMHRPRAGMRFPPMRPGCVLGEVRDQMVDGVRRYLAPKEV
jgi:hypothetical protein